MNIEKKYFHSVHSYLFNDNSSEKDRKLELEDIMSKFDKILKSGYILPSNEIKKLYGSSVNRNPHLNLNNDCMVSVSLHYKNAEPIDEDYKKRHNGLGEDAFQDFILQEPAIVLSESIRCDLRFYKYPGIYLERLLLEGIPLKYMEAVSVFGVGLLQPFFYDTDESLFTRFKQDKNYRVIYLAYLDRLRIMLKDYGYNVPIIDIVSGNEYRENKEYRKILTKEYNENIAS